MELSARTTRKYILRLTCLSFLIFALFSCKDNSKQFLTDVSELEDYYEFQEFDLSPYGIKASIMLPDETANIGASTKPDVEHLESDFYWNIQVGQNFHLYIEDYGDNTDLVKAHKQKLSNTQFYDVKYLHDDTDLIIYQVTLKVRGSDNAPKTVGIKHVSYHVYGEKVINGIHYELRSRDEGFEKPIIDLMAKSILSLKEKK